MKFEWDGGNRSHVQRHGVSIAEVEAAIATGAIGPDWRHSSKEARFVARGVTSKGAHVFVVFTLRGSLVRPISARPMHRKEVEKHEKAQKAAAADV